MKSGKDENGRFVFHDDEHGFFIGPDDVKWVAFNAEAWEQFCAFLTEQTGGVFYAEDIFTELKDK